MQIEEQEGGGALALGQLGERFPQAADVILCELNIRAPRGEKRLVANGGGNHRYQLLPDIPADRP